jgi:pimeloyl-ACP methyl ester carboxylesterase
MPLTRSTKFALTFVAVGLAVATVTCQLHTIGASALLFPARQVTRAATPPACADKTFIGVNGVRLVGWHCASQSQPRRGVVVYLHGIADNRSSAAGIVGRFTSRGFDVIAYDSRAHGASEGEHCTYGYFEKADLQRVLDQSGAERAIVIGHSLGAAVGLQTAAIDSRVRAVVAASTFSDLRTIATERAPFIFSKRSIGSAFSRAEQDAKFRVDDVSPLAAAAAITIPVLLVHGEADRNTSPAHSSRVFDALRGPKQLLMVPAAGHNDVLNGGVWRRIDEWVVNNFTPLYSPRARLRRTAASR